MTVNTYVPRRNSRGRRSSRLKLYVLSVALIIILGSAYYFVAISSALHVKEVQIDGELKYFTNESLMSEIKETLLTEKRTQFFGVDHVLAWSPKFILTHPFIEEFSLDRDILSRKVTVNIKERKRFGIWCFASVEDTLEQCYWFDEKGVTLERAPQTAGALIIQISDTDQGPPTLNQSVAPENFFQIVRRILDVFKTRSMKFSSFTLNRASQEFIAKTEAGSQVVFSLRFDPSDKIFDFLESLIKEGQLEQLRYVDLTVENRIYTRDR